MPPLFGDTASVLVGDDAPGVVEVLEEIVEAEGYAGSHAADVEQAQTRWSSVSSQWP